MAAAITVKLEDRYDDGGYTALITHYGLEFAVHFVKGEINVYGTNTRNVRLGWKLTASAKAVKAFTAERIASFGPEFMALHRALYEMDVAV